MISRPGCFVKPALILSFFFFILSCPPSGGHASLSSQQDGEGVIHLAAHGVERGHSVAFSPDGAWLAVGGTSGIYIYDARSRAQVDFLETGVWARSLVFSPDGRQLAAGLFDQTIRIWDVPGWQVDKTLTGHTGWVRTVSYSVDGSIMASVSDDGSLRTWDPSSGQPLGVLDDRLDGPRVIAVSPVGDVLAVGMRDGSISLYQLSTLTALRILVGHTDWVRALSFSPDGRLLASGGFDTTVRVWQVESGAPLFELSGHTASVLAVAFSPDGKTIASGSVDTTIRLWKVADGSAAGLLEGHTGFVYSVAFSPGRKALASTAEDSTLRLWDLSRPVPPLDPGQNGPPTPSDCRACHHSNGLLRAPRVPEMRCEVCHAGGVSFNWCPFFPRSNQAVDSSPYQHSDLPAGVPVMSSGLAVVLATPANGYAFYIPPDEIGPAVLGGVVYYPGDASEVAVRLEVWSGQELTTTMEARPTPDGAFRFETIMNPGKSVSFSIRPGEKECAICHEEYFSVVPLPNGQVRAVVTATAPDGEQATDERWFVVDVSGRGSISAEVIDAERGVPLAGAPVEGTAVLYNWRERNTRGITGEAGSVSLDLEVLHETPTSYSFAVPDQVIDGVLYEGLGTVEVTFPAGAESLPAISLKARARKGVISGRVTTAAGETLPGAPVWAVKMPAGPATQTQTDGSGAYDFRNLDIAVYQVFSSGSGGEGLPVTSAGADLLASPSTQVDLALLPAQTYTVRPLDERGRWLPFSWISGEALLPAAASSPGDGEIRFAVPDAPEVRMLAAPGYYARYLRISPEVASGLVQLSLVPRPETRSLPWGQGQVVIPGETEARVDGSTIHLIRGWVWGSGDGGVPWLVAAPQGQIEITGGRFAIEIAPNGEGWLYLYDGSSTVALMDSPQAIGLSAGQMIYLAKGSQPVEMAGGAVEALRSPAVPVPQVIFEPGMKARLLNELARLGVGTAQGVTFITYILVFLSIVAIPIISLYLNIRRKAAQKSETTLSEKI